MTFPAKMWISVAVIVTIAVGPAHSYAADADMADIGRMEQFIGVMHGYYSLIDSIHGVASDPEKAAILQMQKISEIYKNRGDHAESIAVLTDVLDRSQSPTVRNAAAIMLAEALNETGRATQAVDVLKQALNENLR